MGSVQKEAISNLVNVHDEIRDVPTSSLISEQYRDEYLKVVENYSKLVEWVNEFEKIVEYPYQIIRNDGSIKIDKCSNSIITFYNSFTIGRGRRSCDYVINNYDDTISRLNLLMYLVENKETGKKTWILLDYWSCCGFSIKGTSFGSYPDNRKIIYIPEEKPFTLVFGQFKNIEVDVNSRICIVCLENTRSFKFNCNHCIACGECARQLLSKSSPCPICRQVITGITPIKDSSQGITYMVGEEDSLQSDLEMSQIMFNFKIET